MRLLDRLRKHKNGSGLRPRHQDPALARLHNETDRLFDRVWREMSRDPCSTLRTLPETLHRSSDWPAMDMAEDDKALIIRMDVPGLDAKQVNVEISGNQLTVHGTRRDEWSEEKDGVYCRERYSGSFARTITLPSYVDLDKVEAKYEKATLKITVPKIPGQGPIRVPIIT